MNKCRISRQCSLYSNLLWPGRRFSKCLKTKWRSLAMIKPYWTKLASLAKKTSTLRRVYSLSLSAHTHAYMYWYVRVLTDYRGHSIKYLSVKHSLLFSVLFCCFLVFLYFQRFPHSEYFVIEWRQREDSYDHMKLDAISKCILAECSVMETSQYDSAPRERAFFWLGKHQKTPPV